MNISTRAPIFSKSNRNLILLILLIKVFLLCFFSSDYQDTLFIPFVNHFLHNFDNPYNHFYILDKLNMFPYPPLMLYIKSLFYLPYFAIPFESILLQNFFFKLSTLLADILILSVLIRLFRDRVKEIIIFYFLSPIIIYSCYMHSQLDLIPTALFILSIYLLTRKKEIFSAWIFGMAISTKFHIIAALPIMIIYLIKTNRIKKAVVMFVLPLLLYFLLALPFLFSEGYFNLVLHNKEQGQIFEVFFSIINLKIYLVPFILLFIVCRFMVYKKVNNHLLYSFMGLLFSCFLSLVLPGPGWYVWIVPFITIFFINHYTQDRKSANLLYLFFSCAYLLYFLFFHFHPSGLTDLKFLNIPLNLKISNSFLVNMSFTILEASIIAVIYTLYKFGIKSNAVYKIKEKPLILGISGASAAGKTTLLENLKLLLNANRVLHIEGDAGHKWERNDKNWSFLTHLNPKANYIHKQAEQILALKDGRSIERMEYDHSSGKFTRPHKVDSNTFIVLCGLHTFCLPKMRKIIDLKIFMDTQEKLRQHWKIKRDVTERGYPRENVMKQILSRVDDSKKYIFSQKQFADITICYYTDDKFETGNLNYTPHLKLNLIVDSNVELDILVECFNDTGITLTHNYSANLKFGHLYIDILDKHITGEYLETISDLIIQNREEIVDFPIQWNTDYEGIIQLIILMMLAEKMKEQFGYYSREDN